MKTKVNKPISPAQIKAIHALLNEKGLLDEKRTIIHSISSGRTESTKELTFEEAKTLIIFLKEDTTEIDNKKRTIYKAIWNIAWSMEIIYGNTEEDYQMNRVKLNMFCRQRGTVKKNLSDMDYTELKKTHRQFEAMFKRHLNNK